MPQRCVAVITGASAGVGRATARAFADEGFDVALLARGSAGLEAAEKEVTAAGARALAIPTDVSVYEEVQGAAERVEAELGAHRRLGQQRDDDLLRSGLGDPAR